jgi:transposase-like protein
MSSTNKEGRKPLYEASFKIAVAREYLTGKKGYGKLAEQYDLPGARTVRHFVSWYKKQYPGKGAPAEPGVTTLIAHSDPGLEKELQQANLKIAGLEMLIEIAQKELGIDIVKKPGTKQSPK